MASKHRVKRGEDYRRIVRSGYRVGGKYCLAHAVLLSAEQQRDVSRETLSNLAGGGSTPPAARFGFIITKALGNAVTRNLMRRRMKGICESAVQQGFAGFEVVFRVFPQATEASYQELEQAVLQQLQRVAAAPVKTTVTAKTAVSSQQTQRPQATAHGGRQRRRIVNTPQQLAPAVVSVKAAAAQQER